MRSYTLSARQFACEILVCRYASPAITGEVSTSDLAYIRGPHRGEELLELVLLSLLGGQDHHREVLVELFFLLLELLGGRRGGLVGLLLAFRVGVRGREALRQALEAPAQRRDVGLFFRRELRAY